jgi:ABC-2 type transport system permease protein
MPGLVTVWRKELADHFSSWRFAILFGVAILAGLYANYVASQSIRAAVTEGGMAKFVFLRLFTASSGVLPSFVSLIGFVGPLVGLALGFDAINRERTGGTLSRVLSQPVFRDSVINGKFLAGLTTIAIILVAIAMVAGGAGLRMIGVTPSLEEVLRILVFLGISIIYVAFWMAIAILFSILFRSTATSALAAIAAWLFFAIFLFMVAGVAADTIAPLDPQPSAEMALRHGEIQQMIMRLSPSTLFGEATSIILNPNRSTLGPLFLGDVLRMRMLLNPLPLSQSLLIVWPHLTALVALTVVCFAISYVAFLRQEIRAG